MRRVDLCRRFFTEISLDRTSRVHDARPVANVQYDATAGRVLIPRTISCKEIIRRHTQIGRESTINILYGVPNSCIISDTHWRGSLFHRKSAVNLHSPKTWESRQDILQRRKGRKEGADTVKFPCLQIVGSGASPAGLGFDVSLETIIVTRRTTVRTKTKRPLDQVAERSPADVYDAISRVQNQSDAIVNRKRIGVLGNGRRHRVAKTALSMSLVLVS